MFFLIDSKMRIKSHATKAILLCLLIQALPGSAHAFQRIVTLSPLLSEWSAELLGDAKAKKVLMGVSEYSDFPEFLRGKPTIGPYHQLQIEKIAALKPDLILASEEYNLPNQIEQLRRLGLPVRVVKPEHFHSMPEWVMELGVILKEEAGAKKAASRWSRDLLALKKQKATRPKKRVLIEIQHQPLITVGGVSFLSDAFTVVGLQNVFQALQQGYPKVSKEAVLKEKPDAVYILDLRDTSEDFKRSQEDWAHYGLHSHLISGSDFARCTPRLLNALKQLN